MPNKYNQDDKKTVLDVYTCFDSIYISDIIDEWKKEYNGLNIRRVSWSANIGENTSIINEQTLINLGILILKDFDVATVHYYQVSIPSESVLADGMEHAVAFMIDHKSKIMRYHDSHGVDMRREYKDFLTKLFPDYKITINYSKQQADVVSKTDKNKNDNSCALLSLYNLRDMWFVQNGMPDKVCNFDSVSARQDAWEILSDIQKKPQEQIKFSFGKSVKTKTKEKILEYEKAMAKIAEKAFKYRLNEEPNYDDLINKAVDTVRAEIKKWHNEKMIHQHTGGRV